MSCTFNGISKLITINNGITSVTVVELYSLWKEWCLVGDNLKYLPAFSVLGGDPTVAGKFLGTTFFLESGWKIKPYSGNHTLTIEGNLYSRDGSSPLVPCDGNYNVLVNLSTSNLIDTVSTGGASGDFPTTNEIASAVNYSLQASFAAIPGNVKNSFEQDMQRLLELYRIMGLDPTQPLIVTQNGRTSGSIQQFFNNDQINKRVDVSRNDQMPPPH